MPLEQHSHAAAAGAYEHQAKEGAEGQRELEARVLLKAVARLEAVQAQWDGAGRGALADVLSYNRKAWLVFYDAALTQEKAGEGDEAARSLRKNIIALARYIFRHEIDVLAEPQAEKLDILISINRNIAAGLMTNTGAAG